MRLEVFKNILSELGDIVIHSEISSSLIIRSVHGKQLKIFFDTHHPKYKVDYDNVSLIVMINKDTEFVCDIIKKYFLENNLLSIKNIKTNEKPGILRYLNNISFDTQRVFYIDSFNDLTRNNTRGFHANINFNELLIVINGSVRMKLIDKSQNSITHDLHKDSVYFISKMLWIEYEILEPNTIIFCMADKSLKESHSIRDFNEFLSII